MCLESRDSIHPDIYLYISVDGLRAQSSQTSGLRGPYKNLMGTSMKDLCVHTLKVCKLCVPSVLLMPFFEWFKHSSL